MLYLIIQKTLKINQEKKYLKWYLLSRKDMLNDNKRAAKSGSKNEIKV
jgi:hypothetical protein